MSKDTFYFSHDYNARHDPKIKALIRKHGLLGYGLFWAIVEDLYNNANALPTDYDSIAFDLRTEPETIKSIVNDFGLFVTEGETFGSMSIQRRIDERNAKSSKARDNANKRWNKDAIAMPSHSHRNAIKESKVKEIKENKDIVPGFDKPAITKSKKELLLERRNNFKEDLAAFLNNPYKPDLLNKFYLHWSESDKSYNKMRFEKEKTWELGLRLAKWAANDYSPAKQQNNEKSVTINLP